MSQGAGKMSQQMKVPATETDNTSLIAHVGRGMSLTYTPGIAQMPPEPQEKV